MSVRTAEHVGILLLSPFWILAWALVGGIFAGVCYGIEALDDVKREWRT